MSVKKTWQKNVSFLEDDKQFIQSLLKNRDKERYRYDGELIVDYLRRFHGDSIEVIIPDVVITPEQKAFYEACKKVCGRGLLKIINTIPTCLQDKIRKPFVYVHPEPEAGKVMRLEDIEKRCEACTIRFTEKERLNEALKGMMNEGSTLYSCKHPDIINPPYYARTDIKIRCPKKSIKEVRIDRTCIKNECEYMETKELTFNVDD